MAIVDKKVEIILNMPVIYIYHNNIWKKYL